jgi:hypothetical protein
MQNTNEKLRELRRRLEVLDTVIADFERLEALRRSKALVSAGGPKVGRYSHRPKFTVVTSLRRRPPAA